MKAGWLLTGQRSPENIENRTTNEICGPNYFSYPEGYCFTFDLTTNNQPSNFLYPFSERTRFTFIFPRCFRCSWYGSAEKASEKEYGKASAQHILSNGRFFLLIQEFASWNVRKKDGILLCLLKANEIFSIFYIKIFMLNIWQERRTYLRYSQGHSLLLLPYTYLILPPSEHASEANKERVDPAKNVFFLSNITARR